MLTRERGERTSDDPLYVQGATRSELWAHFASGTVVQVRRDRRRSYPKLRGDAPSTLAFYLMLMELASGASHVLDAGSGSGEGAHKLTPRFDRVTGVDNDPRAVAYSKEFARRAHFVHADLHQPLAIEPFQAAIFADVLGHLKEPELALLSVRKRLESGVLLIAEPRAAIRQKLQAPARRAYSPRSLTALLCRAGLRVDRWLSDSGTFICCLGRVNEQRGADDLVRARREQREGRWEEAILAYGRAIASPDPAVRHEALVQYGGLLCSLKKGDEAGRVLFEASRSDPGDARPSALLSRLISSTGDAAHALELALIAVDRDPTDPTATASLAQAADALAHPDAFDAWRVCANLLPDDPGAVGRAAALATDRKDYEYAIGLMERLRAYDDPLNATFHVTLGWLLSVAGRRADAWVEARIADARSPGSSDVRELMKSLRETG